MSRFWNTALLSAALMAPISIAPIALRAQDRQDRPAERTYHDKQHNDDHGWNGQEDKAYRIYAKQNHRKYNDFDKLKEGDQQNYWNWRHEHSDTLLKIQIK
jgi:Ni/Co efflux regulator RcnB